LEDDIAVQIDTLKDWQEDVVGRGYEYFLGKFAATVTPWVITCCPVGARLWGVGITTAMPCPIT